MESLEEKMMRMIKENPSEFIKFLEDTGIDFDKTANELDIARKLVQLKYSMDKKSINAVEFVFWFSYFVEREAQDLIVEPEVQLGARRRAVQILTDKLHFGDKISVISELYVENPKKDKFISLMRKVQDLRNAVAHGRFSELEYDGLDLADARGQLKILADLMNALLKKPAIKTGQKN
ncbi:MAG: hypothetical protein AAB534_02605 [Patescibacteria group bacterium]